MPTIEIAGVTYNPAVGAFQARVDICARGRRFRYPCEVAGPMNLDMLEVRKQLARQAINLSDTGILHDLACRD